jgi:hypothetical protein
MLYQIKIYGLQETLESGRIEYVTFMHSCLKKKYGNCFERVSLGVLLGGGGDRMCDGRNTPTFHQAISVFCSRLCTDMNMTWGL